MIRSAKRTVAVKFRSLAVAGSMLATTVVGGVAAAGPASADEGEGWSCTHYTIKTYSWNAWCTIYSGYQGRAVTLCQNGNGGEADFYGPWVNAGYWQFGGSCPDGHRLGGGDTETRRV
jgi:hypothetical protein